MRHLATFMAVFMAAAGFLFAADSYAISTIVGGNFAGDGGPAVSALLFNVEGLVFDGGGSLYIADSTDHRVRRVSPTGIIATVAGNGQAGFTGDGGPATEASLNSPYGLAVDAKGNLYIADLGNGRVRRVSPDGVIRTVAAEPLKSPRNVVAVPDGSLYISDYELHRVFRLSADGKLAPISLAVQYPAGLARDREGNLYVADSGNRRVWRVTAEGRVAVLAGAFDSPIGTPTGVAVDRDGSLYILDADASKVMRREENGQFSTRMEAAGLRDIALDALGNLYAGGGNRVVRATSTGPPATAAGGNTPGEVREREDALQTRLTTPIGIALDAGGNLYIAEQRAKRVRRVDGKGQVETLLKEPAVRDPVAVVADRDGGLRIADFSANRILAVSSSGVVTTLAGTGAAGYSGDGDAASKAKLDRPRGMAFGPEGSLYFADSGNHAIRRISSTGVIATVAGTGQRGSEGDGGRATAARLNNPTGIAFDARGALYIADAGNNWIRRVSADGFISTVKTGTDLTFPTALAVDVSGALFIADSYGHRVLRLAAGGPAETIGGDGSAGFAGDGGPAAKARFNVPVSLAIDSSGGIVVADLENQRIRKLTPKAESTQPVSEPTTPAPAPAPPAPAELVIWSAATLRPTFIAPGQLIAIPGKPPSKPEVRFDQKAAASVTVLPDRLVVRAPVELGTEVEVELRSDGAAIGRTRAAVVDAAPAFFTRDSGTGPVTAILPDGSSTSESNPAPRGSTVTLYATGEGRAAPIRVQVGTSEAEILWSGPAPGFPGVYQLNVRLPGLFSPAGTRPIRLYTGSAASPPGTTIALR
ncbi:MAG: hypothetical protein U0Q16_14050 [Bryobacteraceae bacterium]